MSKGSKSIIKMLSIYSFGIFIYGLLLRFFSIFNVKAQKLVVGRSKTFDIIRKGKAIYPNSDWIWIHASSLGEFEQGRYLIEEIKSKHSSYKIALSFYSPSGYEPRKDYQFADMVFYLPLDSPSNASQLVKLLSPKLAIFIKYDFWWNHLRSLIKYQIPTVFISAMIRRDQYFIKYNLKSLRSILGDITHFYVQNKNSQIILNEKGIKQCTVTGDSRLDSILHEESLNLEIHREILEWKGAKKCIVYGSIHKSDIPIIRELQDVDARHLIVPHDVNDENIDTIRKSVLGSELYSSSGFESNIVILDKTGILRFIYACSDLVYIGGGFGKGIHNILEPLIHHKPIIIGPKYDKFPEATDLVEKDAIRTINTTNQARVIAKDYLNGENNQIKILQDQYIKAKSGSTHKILRSMTKNGWI